MVTFSSFFLQLAHFSYKDMKYTMRTRQLASPSRGRWHYPQDSWSSYEHLLHCHGGGSSARQMIILYTSLSFYGT